MDELFLEGKKADQILRTMMTQVLGELENNPLVFVVYRASLRS